MSMYLHFPDQIFPIFLISSNQTNLPTFFHLNSIYGPWIQDIYTENSPLSCPINLHVFSHNFLFKFSTPTLSDPPIFLQISTPTHIHLQFLWLVCVCGVLNRSGQGGDNLHFLCVVSM